MWQRCQVFHRAGLSWPRISGFSLTDRAGISVSPELRLTCKVYSAMTSSLVASPLGTHRDATRQCRTFPASRGPQDFLVSTSSTARCLNRLFFMKAFISPHTQSHFAERCLSPVPVCAFCSTAGHGSLTETRGSGQGMRLANPGTRHRHLLEASRARANLLEEEVHGQQEEEDTITPRKKGKKRKSERKRNLVLSDDTRPDGGASLRGLDRDTSATASFEDEDRSRTAAALMGVYESTAPHTPVMLEEILGFFRGCQLSNFLDGTLGAGGHSAAILQDHPEMSCLIGLDVDPSALKIAGERIESVACSLQPKPQLHLLQHNFSDLGEVAQQLTEAGGGLNGILLDLGMSSMQVDSAERGFSFMREGPLDMRMGPSAGITAAEIVNTWPQEELGHLIRLCGEDKFWKRIASRIVARRQQAPLTTTQDLVATIGNPAALKLKRPDWTRGLHPATRTFQALRIRVNNELEVLEKALPQAISALAPGGRLGVISFHSLEDRIVKWAFARAAGKTPAKERAYISRRHLLPEQAKSQPIVKVLTKHPLRASDEEAARNPRARSAKLRFVEKL